LNWFGRSAFAAFVILPFALIKKFGDVSASSSIVLGHMYHICQRFDSRFVNVISRPL
jgi:hypothetical protein